MRRRSAFTLIEMVVVVLLAGILLAFAASFYLDLAHASESALEQSVALRRATSVIDRVARDLEAATLVKKPDELDPLEHPWLFLAEGRGSDGADRLRFQARNHRPRPGAGHESDLVDVAYWLSPSEEGEGFDLLRATSAQPLEAQPARTFPRRDDPGVELLASRVAFFAVRLQDADGAWQSAWDSASPAQSSALPIAAEVSVAFLPETPVDESVAPVVAVQPERFVRPIVLVLDPLDLEEALGAEEGEDEEDEDELACLTVAECLGRNPDAVALYKAQNPHAEALLESIGSQCWKEYAGDVPVPVANCDE